MASVITYNQVIELLIDITKRHEQVNTFFLGRNWETENSEDILFPLFQVYPDFGKLTANSYNEYKTQTIRFVCKMLDLTTNGEENKRDVHSDTLRYAQDIVNEFNQHPFYMRSNIKLIGDVDFNEVLQEYQDDVTAGWEFNLTFQLININQFCGMPIQDIPGYAATGPESTGTIVNVQYLTCATLPDCPTIITIDETLIDLQEQIDNLPPSALRLDQVLGYGNSTGNSVITAGTNFSNILQITDTVVSLEWSDTSFGSVILNNSFIKLAHDTFVTIDTVQTLILGEFHHILTGVDTITRIDTVPDSILLSVDRTLDGYDNQVYVERYLTGVSASNVSGAISKLEIHTIPEPLLTGDPSLSNAMIITDNICNKGLVYVADYSANFTDNSLVTKAWVLAQTPAAPSLQTVISVSSVINGFLAQSLDNGTYITLSNSVIDMSSYDGTTTSGFNMYAATGNNLYSDVSNSLNAPITTITSDQIKLTSNSNNASVSIVSPSGFYYPTLSFFNDGVTATGSITGYAGRLYVSPLSLSGTIDMGANKIVNMAPGTNPDDAVILSQVDTKSVTSIVTSTTEIIPLGINNINYSITALASALTIQTSGTAIDFDKLVLRIKDDGTARALTFDPAFFEAKGMALPTTTVLGKVITIGFIFDIVTNKYGCVSVAQEI